MAGSVSTESRCSDPVSATRTTSAQKAEPERQDRLVDVLVSRLLAMCCQPGDSLSMRGVAVSGILYGMIELSYESGTLLAGGGKPPKPFVWDGRTEQWRAPAGA